MILNTRNLLLSNLPSQEIESLAPFFERVPFGLNFVFEQRHSPIEHVYFIESGIASVVAQTTKCRVMEVGLFGRDGMTGHSLFASDTQSPFECFAQMPGEALRISVPRLLQCCDQSGMLRSVLPRFARAFALQTAFTTLATGHAQIEQRLARWLLMVHDRVDGDSFTITHELLSLMIGVRRQSITVALQVLEGNSLIRSTRSTVEIRDRIGLINKSEGTYGPAEDEYHRLTGFSNRACEDLTYAA